MARKQFENVYQPVAKINIGLYVVARREDGYHNLETVFYPVPLSDTLELQPLQHSDAPYHLQLAGFPMSCAPEKNLIIRVYENLRQSFEFPAMDIYLDKKIPMGAGLGGGSSDAATMMKALNEIYQLGMSAEEMEERLASFGADCPFFVKQRPVFATGIGDKMSALDVQLKGYYVALVKPDVFVSTAEAYAGVTPQPAPIDLREVLQQPPATWKDCVHNDFENSVFLRYPQLSAIKETLYDMGAVYAAMSGSGSTIYGLFAQKPYDLKKIFTDCFTYQARLMQ